ncbi:hypothetical protein KM043_003338 [Ampulex compressa]|nr:hypothetical protein KM043_003338 [Ampulex compressa]
MAMVRWFLRAALHCALLVLLVRPEEVFVSTALRIEAEALADFGGLGGLGGSGGSRSSEAHAKEPSSDFLERDTERDRTPAGDANGEGRAPSGGGEFRKSRTNALLQNTTPPPVRSNFSCYAREPGFYADVQANCRVYHTCDDYGNKFSYRCPEETAFRQDALICDHAHLVDCRATAHSEPPRRPNEKRESLRLGLPSFFKFGSLELGNPRRAFSRSFQVVQRPDKSTPKTHPGFVFSASVFLRDLEEPQSRRNAEGREGNGLRIAPPLPPPRLGRRTLRANLASEGRPSIHRTTRGPSPRATNGRPSRKG